MIAVYNKLWGCLLVCIQYQIHLSARVKSVRKKEKTKKNVSTQRSAHAVAFAESQFIYFASTSQLVPQKRAPLFPRLLARLKSAALAMSTSGAPQSQPQSSEHYFGAELAKKTSSRTQDGESRSRERRFTALLEFLMPVYLLPFVFGNAEGVGIYCVLLTLVFLTGRLLPPAVAAMLPLVILPLAGIFAVDQVAAEFLGPRVLAAWLLFAIAIVGDETTLFARACLYALQQFALRMQPLFLSLQLVVLALSLFLPSSFIVVFGTVLIERFFAVVQREIITADQRSGLRAPTSSSTENFIKDVRYTARQRRLRRVAAGGNTRRARRVSMASDMTMASDASHSSSLVRQYKLHPEWLKEPGFEAQKKAAKKQPRKTSFDPFDRTSDAGVWACRLPIRTIRSFAPQKTQPSSILKGSSSKGKEPEPGSQSQRKTTATTINLVKSPNPAAVIPKNRQLDSRANVVRTVELPDKVSSTPSSESSKKAKCEPANKASIKHVDETVIELSVVHQTTTLPADNEWRGSGHPVERRLPKTSPSHSPGGESPPLEMQLQQTLTAEGPLYRGLPLRASLEVRGVLKAARSKASLQSLPQGQRESPTTRRWSLTSMDRDTTMAATMNGGPTKPRPIMCDSAWRRAAGAGRNENSTSGRRIVIASQPYVQGDAASSFRENSHR
ncbi:hypothetical protein HPB49_021857 [Dermacentor silvarum]|uniref:Uncharacterized protein n=1 Tax=Dermacentor silvarum TaxID=543639 RepID=A0ACB8D8F5_DERSI|nr:hypothetical protein HPB49_021857 [Dermacentor silvarum]